MRPIIVALDVSTQQQALALVDQLANENDLMVKVGMELFLCGGPDDSNSFTSTWGSGFFGFEALRYSPYC
ncbi:orotidine 5'-phosphate decarboxylase / HUMPS family protein [Levilactobacillus brevis]